MVHLDERKIDLLEKRLRSARRVKDGEVSKVRDEVFDRSTLLTLYDLITRGWLRTLEFPISSGKEGNVFLALGEDGGMLAVKIYRVRNASFREMTPYIRGDQRFRRIGRSRRRLIHEWCRKEFSNLQRYAGCGLPVPAPVTWKDNVLVMEYVSDGRSSPAPTMRISPPGSTEQAREWRDMLLEFMVRGHDEAGLVHADLSEYNVLISGEGPVVIDVGQAVLRSHPNAGMFFRRDLDNVLRYFERIGVPVEGGVVEDVLSVRGGDGCG